MNSELPGELLRALRRLTIATVVLYVVLAAVVAWIFIDGVNKRDQLSKQTAQISAVALSTNNALCVLRGDLEQRVIDSRKFLESHPDGVAGIPAATIRQSIENQQHTIVALSDLKC